jgi:outer membrane cobalamin receptor
MRPIAVLFAIVWLITPASNALAAGQVGPADLARATLEDLLNVTITTATRTAEGASTAPARVQVVTAEQIVQRGYRSLADVLKDLADFKVDLAGDQDYPTELTVQGTRGASRVVLLLDGVRISSPTNEPLPILANYPVHSARQIEVVYGPASALYGADAFSAVINIISKDVVDSPGFAASSSVGQFGLRNETASYGMRIGSNASLMLAGQFYNDRQPDLSRYYPQDFGGLVGQHTGVFNTIFGAITPPRSVSPAYDVPISAHSLQATLRAGGLQLSLFENRSRTSTSPAYTPDNAVYNAAAFNENALLVASGSYTRPIGRVTSISTLTFSRHELDPDSGYWNVYSNFEKSFKYAYGSMIKADEQLSWKPARTVTATAGATFEHFYAIPQGADLNEPVRSQDTPGTILDTNIPDDFYKVRYANAGVFGQLQYAMTPKLSLTFGLRGDYNTRYGATLNPRIGFIAQPTGKTTVKVLYGTAFLAPSPYQAYAHWGSFYTIDGGATYASNYWHVPNPDLQPQHKRTFEGQILQSLNASFALSASIFYSRYTNLVQESDAAQAYTGFYRGWPVDYIDFPVNQGHQTTYGGTVGLDYVHSFSSNRRITARAALSLADGRVWDNDQAREGLPIGGMAPAQLRLGAEIEEGRWTFAPRVGAVGSQRLLATEIASDGSEIRRTLDGYSTVDVNVRRRTVFRNVDAFVMVENAFDVRYRSINTRAYTNPEEMIGAPQNPRRVTVGFDLHVGR